MHYFQPTVVYDKYEENRQDSIIEYIGDRVLRNNKNFLCALTGQTGNGKSWAGCSICEKYSKRFNIPFDPKIQVVTELVQILKLINNKELEKKIGIGSPILFDEPQVAANARAWQSEANQILSILISTFRNKRLVVFFATPYLEFIDKQSRILFHGNFEVKGFDKTTELTEIKPRFLDYSPQLQDFYRKRLVVKYPNQEETKKITKKLTFWHINKPSDEVIKQYEAIKQEFSDITNKKMLERATKKTEKIDRTGEFLKFAADYDRIGENILEFSKLYPHLTPEQIKKYCGYVKKSHNTGDTSPNK